MHYSVTLAAFLLSFGVSSANRSKPPSTYVPPNADCHNYIIPVTVTSENLQWSGPRWADDYEWTDFLSSISTRPSAGFPPPFGNPINETATYEISATFCKPKISGPKSKTVLLATHGLGFDGSYWNSPKEPDKYNFAQHSIEKGYSVFFYDRLGVGQSEKISGYKNQFSIQAAILSSLAQSIHSGKYTTIGPARSLILIGHSFGSALANAVTAQLPTLIAATILTDFGLNGSSLTNIAQGLAPRIANLQRPEAFRAYDSAYLTNVDIFASINFFFKAPDYDPAIARFAEATKQPFGVFELLSIRPAPASRYTGALLVAAGEFDYPFCAGYCPGGVLDDGFEGFFPNAKRVTYIHPGAGHGLNFARNATGFFDVVVRFLEKSGL